LPSGTCSAGPPADVFEVEPDTENGESRTLGLSASLDVPDPNVATIRVRTAAL